MLPRHPTGADPLQPPFKLRQLARNLAVVLLGRSTDAGKSEDKLPGLALICCSDLIHAQAEIIYSTLHHSFRTCFQAAVSCMCSADDTGRLVKRSSKLATSFWAAEKLYCNLLPTCCSHAADRPRSAPCRLKPPASPNASAATPQAIIPERRFRIGGAVLSGGDKALKFGRAMSCIRGSCRRSTSNANRFLMRLASTAAPLYFNVISRRLPPLC